jgi:hypothetical protein
MTSCGLYMLTVFTSINRHRFVEYIHAVGYRSPIRPTEFRFNMIYGCGIYISPMSSRFCTIGRSEESEFCYVVVISCPQLAVFVTTLLSGRMSSVRYNCCTATTYTAGIWNTNSGPFSMPSSCHGVAMTSENTNFLRRPPGFISTRQAAAAALGSVDTSETITASDSESVLAPWPNSMFKAH